MKKCIKCSKEFDTPGVQCQLCRKSSITVQPKTRLHQRAVPLPLAIQLLLTDHGHKRRLD